jgi:hypothetical protein
VQVVDPSAARAAGAGLDDDRGAAGIERAQDHDVEVAARGVLAMVGDELVDVEARAGRRPLDHGRAVELRAHPGPVALRQRTPQALGGVHAISTTILPSLPPAAKRS